MLDGSAAVKLTRNGHVGLVLCAAGKGLSVTLGTEMSARLRNSRGCRKMAGAAQGGDAVSALPAMRLMRGIVARKAGCQD